MYKVAGFFKGQWEDTAIDGAEKYEQRSYSSLIFVFVVDNNDDRGCTDHDSVQGDSSCIDTSFYVEAPGLNISHKHRLT